MPQARTAPTKPAVTSFVAGQLLVHPSFGVTEIMGVETRTAAGTSLEGIALSVPGQKAVVFVPIPKVAAVGLRHVSPPAEVDAALALTGDRPKVAKVVWSRRAMEIEAKISLGTLVAWAEVMRDMYKPESDQEPSYSQKQLYESARDRFAGEYAASHGVTLQEAMEAIARAAYAPKGGARAAAPTDADDDAEAA